MPSNQFPVSNRVGLALNRMLQDSRASVEATKPVIKRLELGLHEDHQESTLSVREGLFHQSTPPLRDSGESAEPAQRTQAPHSLTVLKGGRDD